MGKIHLKIKVLMAKARLRFKRLSSFRHKKSAKCASSRINQKNHPKKLMVSPYPVRRMRDNVPDTNDSLAPPLEKKPLRNTFFIVSIILMLAAVLVLALYQPPFLNKSSITADISSSDYRIETTDKAFTSKVSTHPAYLRKFSQLNPDTVGYIKIDHTVIDYPVVQSSDNDYYITHGFDRLESTAGAIFMDYRCDINDFSKTRNIILYGHRMKDGTMFKGLLQYENEDFFIEHPIIAFDTLNETLQWEIFSVFETTTDFYYIDTEFPYDEMWVDFLNVCHQLSMYDTYMNFYKDDIILTLSTCTTEENGRFVVMAKMIR